jgi:hypothetical protein
VREYVTASGILRRMIQSRADNGRLALLGSFTFMFFEVVQGNELGLFAIWKSIYRLNAGLS